MIKLPHRRQFLHLAASAAALPVVSRIARAQAYPTQPITIVVPFAAGGATDTIARIIAERMPASLRQTIALKMRAVQPAASRSVAWSAPAQMVTH